MKKSTIKNLRTTSKALVIAILASATAIYGIGISPVHASFGPTAIGITSGNPVTVTAFAALGNGITYITVRQLDSAGNLLDITSTPFPCTNPVCPPARGRSPASTSIPVVNNVVKLHIEVGSTDPDHSSLADVQDASCAGSPVVTGCILTGSNCTNNLCAAAQTETLSPGSGQILIHEYTSVDLEMQAFQAGSIDLVDWSIPAAYLTAWNNCAGATPIGPSCNGQVTTSKHVDWDMYQLDMNENGSRVASQLGFRQAMGYLVDRQNIVLNIGSGFKCPIASGAACGQEGFASPQSLGYPGPYGDYNQFKALEVLYESGWRYDSASAGPFLYGPALPGALGQVACSSTIPGQTGNFCVRTITFLIRSDDPQRLGAGQAMASTMATLPNQFCTPVGGVLNPNPPCLPGSVLITVCPAASCRLDVTTNVAAEPALAKIILHHQWNTWDLYTGGWNLDHYAGGGLRDLLVAEDLPFLYTSGSAPTADCGLWQGDFPLNYDGFCNASFDTAAHAILNAATISQADAASFTAQQVGWGYSASAQKITGLEPTVPMYSHLAYKAAWLKDVNSGLDTSGNPSTGSTTYASRACWQNLIGNEVGTGLNIYQTVIGMFDDNCGGNTAGHKSFVGNPNAVLDWGFINPIESLNIMQSAFTSDVQAMQQTYDTMLGRNPANPSELIPFLCNDYSVGTYSNTNNAATATYYACHLRPDLFWSDGVPLTAQDIAFSTDYIAESQAPLYASNVANLCGPNFVAGVQFYSPTNCGNGVQIVNNPDGSQTVVFYFDSVGAVLPLLVGLGIPIIPQHVYCNDWTGPAAGKLGPGAKATVNCLFPDMGQLPDRAGLSDGSCSDCPAFPGSYPDGTAVPIPSYLSSIGYGSTGASNCGANGFSACAIHNWQTGSGPYMIANCGGSSCGNTVKLVVNPYWHDGVRMASPATGDVADATGLHGGLSLQPDLNRDGFVNSTDLAIAQAQVALAPSATDWRFSVDFRQGSTGTETIAVPSSVCGTGCTTPTLVASFTGWPTTSTDVYIIQKLIQEASHLGHVITWPPQTGSVTNKNGYLPSGVVASLSYIWPDATVHDTVNVNDLVYVFLHQFVAVVDPVTGNFIPASPYNADVTHDGVIDVHDLVTTLTREFSAPAGVNP